MNTILIGQAEEHDIVQASVRDMLSKPGVWIAGDTARPGMTVPLVVSDGRVYCMKVDDELNAERFLPTMTLHGPYQAGPAAPLGEAFCYSTDGGEEFRGQCDSVDAALAEAAEELQGQDEPGEERCVHVGRVKHALEYLQGFEPTAAMVERMNDWLEDGHIGGADDDIVELAPEHAKMLDGIILRFLGAHAKFRRYGVEDESEHIVVVPMEA